MRIRNARTDIWADETLRRVKTTQKEFATIARQYKARILSETNFVESVVLMEEWEQTILNVNREPLPHQRALGLLIGRLDALERYERRAISRRNRVLHELANFDQQTLSGLSLI